MKTDKYETKYKWKQTNMKLKYKYEWKQTNMKLNMNGNRQMGIVTLYNKNIILLVLKQMLDKFDLNQTHQYVVSC